MSSNLNQTIIKVDKIAHDIGWHKLYMKQLAYHTIDQSARSRRNNLIFYWLADSTNENIYIYIIKAIKQLKWNTASGPDMFFK
jgi:hypothetical protein